MILYTFGPRYIFLRNLIKCWVTLYSGNIFAKLVVRWRVPIHQAGGHCVNFARETSLFPRKLLHFFKWALAWHCTVILQAGSDPIKLIATEQKHKNFIYFSGQYEFRALNRTAAQQSLK